MSTQPSGPPIKPQPPCGGLNQPPCPPVPTAVIGGVALYTVEQMHEHGADCYRHGRLDKALEMHQTKQEMETDL